MSMSMQRINVIGLLASIVIALGPARSQDFNQRYAAWQGRAGGMQRAVPQGAAPQTLAPQMTAPATSSAAPEVGGEAEALPTPRGAGSTTSQRILGEVYDAPMHTPNYNNPWATGCASCYHNPGFEPPSDPIGTCNYMGGGPFNWGAAPCNSCGQPGCLS